MKPIIKDRIIIGLVIVIVLLLGYYNVKLNKEQKSDDVSRSSKYKVTRIDDAKDHLLIDVETTDGKNSWFIYTYKPSGNSIMLRNRISYDNKGDSND